MRQPTALETQNEEFLAQKGIRYATILMTDNILSHSIFDANRQIVKFLKEMSVHDYETQEKGTEAKVMIDTHILTFKEEVMSKSSLYKAGTRGDKRMWFGAEILPYVDDDQIVAIFVKGGEFYILNESKLDIELCYTTSMSNPIKKFLREYINSTTDYE